MNPIRQTGYRVLVVDDDPSIRGTYLHILRPPASEVDQLEALISGKASQATPDLLFQVTVAAQGEEAAALQRAALEAGTPPQVAFIDMRMPPGWDGLRTAVALRAQDPAIYVVIATAFSDYDVNELQRALSHDVVLLRKPFNQEEVYQLARTLCQSWETRRRLEQVTAEMESQVLTRTAELDLRVAQQTALAEIATRFVDQDPDEETDDAVVWALTRIGRLLDADGCAVLAMDPDQSAFSMTHEWTAYGMRPLRAKFQSVPLQTIAPISARLLRGEPYAVARLADLRPEMTAVADGLAGEREAILAVPVVLTGKLVGAMAIAFQQVTEVSDKAVISLLRTAGHIVFRALEAAQYRRRLLHDQTLLEATEHAAHIGNWSLDAGTLTARWDDEIRNILGIAPGQPAGLAFLATLVHADDWPMVQRSLNEALGRSTAHNLEYRIQRGDGSQRWVHCWAEPEFDSHGRVRSLRGMLQDITDRKATEEALRRERDTTRNILQTVEAMIVVLDREGRISLINRKGCEILGYREEELIGRDWFTTCLPANDQVDAVREIFRKALAEDLLGSEYYENPVRTRSGALRLIAWHNSTVRNTEGRVIGGMSAGEDITDRRHADARLKQIERIFAAAPDGFALVGGDYRYQIVNPAYEGLVGLRSGTLVGLSVADHLGAAQFAERVKPHLDRVLAGAFIRREDWFDYASPGRRFVSLTCFPYRDEHGFITGVVMSTRDITELERQAAGGNAR